MKSVSPFSATSGMTPGGSLRMLLVGEAWGESEEAAKRPFVGASGKELFLMLGEALGGLAPELHREAVKAFHFSGGAWIGPREAWLRAAGIGMTNVLGLRPPDNKIEALCLSKADLPDKGKGYPFGPIALGKYLKPEFFPELARLREEIEQTRPNIIIALGNTACWALLSTTGIGAIRGTTSLIGNGWPLTKVLPTYHPAGVMRNWSWRPIVVADLMKGWREGERKELIRPRREVEINPTLGGIGEWMCRLRQSPPPRLSVDIETAKGMITCIGFGTSRTEAIVIPFAGGTSGSYWPSAKDEQLAWLAVAEILRSPIPKVFQNGMYDLQYIMKMGMIVGQASHDSMLLHHSIFPELQKGLGFLGSIYTSEPAWKLMRKHKGDEVGVKADE